MPGPAFAEGAAVSLHPIEDEDHEFLQYGRNHPSTRKPLTETTIRSVDDVPEMLGEYHFLVCADERSESAGEASGEAASSVDDQGESTGDASGEAASSVDDQGESTEVSSGEAASNQNADTDPERVGVVAFTYTRGTTSGSLMYWVAPEHRGNGYADEAVDLFLEYAFAECGFHKVFARTIVTNDPSVAFLESKGFEREGRFREEKFVDGEWVDAFQYSLLADEWLDAAEA
jgi:RimJ/RimL family protein N-acetyltransferase